MIDIVTVLYKENENSDFTSLRVNTLFELIRRNVHVPLEYRFHCITNAPEGLDSHINRHLIDDTYFGWFNKLRAFDSNLFPNNRVCLIDIDMVPIANLDELLKIKGDMCLVPSGEVINEFRTSLAIFNSYKFHFVWDYWESIQDDLTEDDMSTLSDQNLLNLFLHNLTSGDSITQDLKNRFSLFEADKNHVTPIPSGWVPSYKEHLVDMTNIDRNVRVVAFHGEPRPWQI